MRVCFIFLLCMLMTSANISLEKKIFHWVENVIKQLVYTSAVHSSRYEALGKFREHSRSQSCSRLCFKQLLCIFRISVHLSCSPNFLCASYRDECTLTYEPIVNYEYRNLSFLSFGPGRQMCAVPCCCMNIHATKLSANPLIKDAYVALIIFLSQEGKLTCQTFFIYFR